MQKDIILLKTIFILLCLFLQIINISADSINQCSSDNDCKPIFNSNCLGYCASVNQKQVFNNENCMNQGKKIEVKSCKCNNGKCKIASINEEKLSKEYLKADKFSCNINSDCIISFDFCECSYTCTNIYKNKDIRDCFRDCPNKENQTISSCECLNFQCKESQKIENKNTLLSVSTPNQNIQIENKNFISSLINKIMKFFRFH